MKQQASGKKEVLTRRCWVFVFGIRESENYLGTLLLIFESLTCPRSCRSEFKIRNLNLKRNTRKVNREKVGTVSLLMQLHRQ